MTMVMIEKDVFCLFKRVEQEKSLSPHELKTYSIYKHDTVDISDPSSMQDMCHMNFVIGLAPIESLWLNGKALEHGIWWSEAQFLIGTQSFSLSHACDKKKKKPLSLFLYWAQNLPCLLFFLQKW